MVLKINKMSKRNKKILTAIVILLLLYYLYKIYLDKSKKGKTTNGNGGNLGEARYRCDAGGCLECPPNIPNIENVCPFTDSNCGSGCTHPPIITPPVPKVVGCMDNTQLNYDPLANFPCRKCCVPIIYGCNDPTAINYYRGVSSGYGCTNNVNDTSCCVYSL
jgi:hypothetical protein